MKHDRHPHRVNLEKCAHGYLLNVDGGAGCLGTLYAYDNIEGVVQFLLDQYGELTAIAIETGTGETERLDPKDKSAGLQGIAQTGDTA